MKVADHVVALEQRIHRLDDKAKERFDAIDKRFDVVEQRIDRFEAKVDERFTKVDDRFDRFESRVDERFDELRRHLDVIAEAARDDFRNLYDLVQAHMTGTEIRFGTIARDLRAEMRLGDEALSRRVAALEESDRAKTKRGRR